MTSEISLVIQGQVLHGEFAELWVLVGQGQLPCGGSENLAAFQCLSQKFVFQAFDYEGLIGRVSCIPDHLTPEVSAEAGNLSVPGIWG